MAKEPEKPEQQPSLSLDQLERLLDKIDERSSHRSVELIKTYLEESRKKSPDQIAKEEKAKQHWRVITQQTKETEEGRVTRCNHMHPRENKSLFCRKENSTIIGAWSLICVRCFKMIHNYKDGRLINNPEFNHWVNIPAFVDAADF